MILFKLQLMREKLMARTSTLLDKAQSANLTQRLCNFIYQVKVCLWSTLRYKLRTFNKLSVNSKLGKEDQLKKEESILTPPLEKGGLSSPKKPNSKSYKSWQKTK